MSRLISFSGKEVAEARKKNQMDSGSMFLNSVLKLRFKHSFS